QGTSVRADPPLDAPRGGAEPPPVDLRVRARLRRRRRLPPIGRAVRVERAAPRREIAAATEGRMKTQRKEGLASNPLAAEEILERFYRPGDAPAAAPKKEKPTHYKVVCISLYTEDIERLEALVAELKRRGHTKANKS